MSGAAAKRLARAPQQQGRGAGKGGGLNHFVASVIGAATANPEAAPLIYQDAAERVARAASQQRDAKAGRRLHALAQQLAAAALREQATIDDFQELLAETAEAYDDVGANDLDVLARRDQIHDARPGGVQRVSIAPESFNRSTTLGRSGIFKYNPTATDRENGIKQSDTVALWQGTSPEAQAITVDVGMVAPPPLDRTADTPAAGARPYCVITYGSDGCRVEAKLDVGYGVRFTVVCNFVSVLVGMDPPADGADDVQMTIGASLGTFAAPSLSPVILTRYIDDLANDDDSDFIPRPLKAVQLLPILTNATAGNTFVAFYALGGATPLYEITFPSNTLAMSPVPLAGDVAFIRVSNNTGGAANYRLPFQLSL